LPDLAPADFFLFSKLKNVEMPTFYVNWLEKGKFASGPAHYPKWSVPEMFRRMEETLGVMYSKVEGTTLKATRPNSF
jgi:hypothetical protein